MFCRTYALGRNICYNSRRTNRPQRIVSRPRPWPDHKQALSRATRRPCEEVHRWHRPSNVTLRAGISGPEEIMETLKKNMTGQESANPPAGHPTRRWDGHEQALKAPGELWPGGIFAALNQTEARRPASRKRKRRLYADYRELLALES